MIWQLQCKANKFEIKSVQDYLVKCGIVIFVLNWGPVITMFMVTHGIGAEQPGYIFIGGLKGHILHF